MPITPTPEEHQDPTLEHESPQGDPAQEKPETTQFVRPARREAQPNPAYRNAVLQAQEAHEQARGPCPPRARRSFTARGPLPWTRPTMSGK